MVIQFDVEVVYPLAVMLLNNGAAIHQKARWYPARRQ